MDAMSDAIEGADVMLYGVSLAYKESANVSASSCLAVWCDACSCWLGFFGLRVVGCDIVWRMFSVSIGGQLRPPAGARYDPADDAERLQASGLA